MQFLDAKKWHCTISVNVFSSTKQKHISWKIYKVKKVFWLCCGSVLFSISCRSRLRFIKWTRIFKWNCIVKWVIFFTSFCWLWDFLLENMKLKKNSGHVHWYTQNNISKKESQIWVFESFIFWSKVHFLGTSLGLFSQFFFFVIFFVIFCRRSTTVTEIFTQPPTRNMKKLPTALSSHNFLLLSIHCVWKSTTINWNFFFWKDLN